MKRINIRVITGVLMHRVWPVLCFVTVFVIAPSIYIGAVIKISMYVTDPLTIGKGSLVFAMGLLQVLMIRGCSEAILRNGESTIASHWKFISLLAIVAPFSTVYFFGDSSGLIFQLYPAVRFAWEALTLLTNCYILRLLTSKVLS